MEVAGYYLEHEWCWRRSVSVLLDMLSSTDASSVYRWPNARSQQSVLENQNPNQSRQSNQHRQTNTGAVVFLRAAGPDLTSMSGNAWANNDRGSRETFQQGPSQEQHVPVNGFNAQDARNILKNGVCPSKFC